MDKEDYKITYEKLEKLKTLPHWNIFWPQYYKVTGDWSCGPAATTFAREDLQLRYMKTTIKIFENYLKSVNIL